MYGVLRECNSSSFVVIHKTYFDIVIAIVLWAPIICEIMASSRKQK